VALLVQLTEPTRQAVISSGSPSRNGELVNEIYANDGMMSVAERNWASSKSKKRNKWIDSVDQPKFEA
jgi:hypothetical protein